MIVHFENIPNSPYYMVEMEKTTITERILLITKEELIELKDAIDDLLSTEEVKGEGYAYNPKTRRMERLKY